MLELQGRTFSPDSLSPRTISGTRAAERFLKKEKRESEATARKTIVIIISPGRVWAVESRSVAAEAEGLLGHAAMPVAAGNGAEGALPRPEVGLPDVLHLLGG